jgi:hypothetical protein
MDSKRVSVAEGKKEFTQLLKESSKKLGRSRSPS